MTPDQHFGPRHQTKQLRHGHQSEYRSRNPQSQSLNVHKCALPVSVLFLGPGLATPQVIIRLISTGVIPRRQCTTRAPIRHANLRPKTARARPPSPRRHSCCAESERDRVRERAVMPTSPEKIPIPFLLHTRGYRVRMTRIVVQHRRPGASPRAHCRAIDPAWALAQKRIETRGAV